MHHAMVGCMGNGCVRVDNHRASVTSWNAISPMLCAIFLAHRLRLEDR